ncbi:MAG TPA: ATP-binding cassette domain-containing protein [Acidimicrobiales bacterium]|nr:ATP-binding cassette domain-containing protein [Acidimicrobiales bacterium]
MSLGSWVLGLLNGLTIGLLAVGLVLVYKANRFLNLAHAQLGTLSALLLAKWVLDWGWSWWVAFILAVVVGVATGLLVERFFIGTLRRRGATPVRLLLMSVAVSFVLLGLTFVPSLGPNMNKAPMFPQPFSSSATVGGVVLTGMWILTAALVPALVLGLAAFLRFTTIGKGIRAAANNPDAARLCGISVSKVSAITWGLAGGLSAVSAVMQAPTQPSFNLPSLGPYLLMLTLGAAAFGAFVSLPWAFAGGIVLGLISQNVSAITSDASQAELAVFVAIFLVVFLRGRSIGRVFALTGGLAEATPVTRIPAVLRNSPLVRHQRAWMGAAAVLVALIFPKFPYFDTAGHRFLLILVLVYALIGIGLTMLIGWAGQVSLGHFAVVGLGAYLAARWGPHWSLPAVLLVAGVIGAAVMVLVGLPALRVGGLALAVTTMAFAVICADWLYRQDWVGSSQSFVNINPIGLGPDLGTPSSQLSIYYVALVVLVLGGAGAAALRKWGPGRLVIATRDNENAVSSFGISPATVKLMILAVSGLYAAVAGVLWADAWKVASPDQFTADFSVAIIAIPVIGGLGSVSGAVAAAVVIYATTFFVGPSVSSVFGNFGHNLGFQLFLAGIGQAIVLLQWPRGLAGLCQTVWQRYLERRAPLVETWAPVYEEEPEVTVPASGTPDLLTGSPAAPGPAARSSRPGRSRAASAGRNGKAPVLATEGIGVRFGGVVALDGPDINVRPGEIVGLIGPNGAGKTTLMNVVSGVLRPDQGSVRIYGREVADLPPDFRAAFGVARTFQDARLFGGLTVTETLQVAMTYQHKVGAVSAMLGAPWAQAAEVRTRMAAEEIVDRFGLRPWADTLTSELSTGTRRICDLAAQVAAGPDLLLLDEPTAGVAQREAEAFGPLLRRIRDELDCSVLIVEHDMPLLMGLCDRVYAMEAGRVIAEGTPVEIRNDPRVVESYLGTGETAIRRSGDRAEVGAGAPAEVGPAPSGAGRRPGTPRKSDP